MREKIEELERTARLLEPDAAGRRAGREKALAYAENFLDTIHARKAYEATAGKGEGIVDSPISEEPMEMDEALRFIEENVDRPGLNPASGGHLGYVPGGGIYFSALGDYLAAVTNRYAGVFFASPGAVRMENHLIRWMAGLVGYPESCGGNLASGGSIANLIAVVTARDAHGIRAADVEKTVVYAGAHMHHCLHKSLRIAGLKECVLRYVDLDEGHRIKSDVLERMIAADRAAGLRPWLVIASAGTTDMGAIDPLEEIGRIAKQHGLWYHIDGAYGAFFALCEEGRKKLRGMELSDSLVMDPHKGLFLPYGLGAVLVKDRQKLVESHYYQASYMQDAVKGAEEYAPADASPELTKHFRGLRLWLPLMVHGLKPFRACVEEKLWLAKYFYEELRKMEGFEVGPAPELSIVTFRYVPPMGDVDAVNERIVEAVVRDGRFFFSSTRINGKFLLRVCVLSFRTHLDTIDMALRILKEKAEEASQVVLS